jgi:hypothetical protein
MYLYISCEKRDHKSLYVSPFRFFQGILNTLARVRDTSEETLYMGDDNDGTRLLWQNICYSLQSKCRVSLAE